MALYIDGGLSDLTDLSDHESGILDLAKSAGVDLGAKLKLAWEELGSEIEGFLRRNGGEGWGASLRQVVATAPLRRCHALLTLALAFRDAACGQANERYEKRYRTYETLYRQALRKAMEGGIGVVAAPLPAPAAPEVRGESGAGPTTPLYVRVTWVNGKEQESAPSEAVLVESNGSTVFRVRMRAAVEGATGWNVYVGDGPDEVRRANPHPLGLEEEWRLDGGGVTSFAGPGEGQSVERWIREERRLKRG
jgi:hypothetical protein